MSTETMDQLVPAVRSGANRNVGEIERWISMAAGAAIAIYGLTRRSGAGSALAASGGLLVARGAAGHCPLYQSLGINTAETSREVSVQKTMSIHRTPQELYRAWRHFEDLPQYMTHLEQVVILDEQRSRWRAKAPLGQSVEWVAEIVEDVPGERIAWRSLADSDVENRGRVEFHAAPAGRGTEVRVSLQYAPPAGAAGAVFAKVFGEEPAQQIREDLRRFKQQMETGEIATVEGQSAGPIAG